MPVDPNHRYVDEAHKKTVHLTSEGWRYGCHSSKLGEYMRGGQTAYRAHPWNVTGRAWVITDWKEINCGHSERHKDAACDGCSNQGAQASC